MFARSLAALLMFLVAFAAAEAQTRPRPQIPSSELPGRERDRFIDKFPEPRATKKPLAVMPDTSELKARPKKKRRVR